MKRFFLFVAILAIASLACSKTVTVNSPVVISDPQVSTATQAPAPTAIVFPTNAVEPTFVPSPTPIVVAPTSGPAYNGETDMVLDNGFRMYRPDADWIGDDFDPKEYTLPGTISGPAVANLKSYRGSICGVVKVNEGETLVWPGGGAYWRAGSQLALAARWEHHVDEFLADYPECNNVYGSAKDVPNPTQ